MRELKISYDLDKYFENKIEKIRSDPDLSEKNKEIILRYLRESQLGRIVRKGQKKEIGSGRNIQTAGFLNLMAKEWFKKDLDKVTSSDMEQFIITLNTGILSTWRNNKGHKSAPYFPLQK
jgi:hypothetical protein